MRSHTGLRPGLHPAALLPGSGRSGGPPSPAIPATSPRSTVSSCGSSRTTCCSVAGSSSLPHGFLPGSAGADLLARLRGPRPRGLAINELVRSGRVSAPVVIDATTTWTRAPSPRRTARRSRCATAPTRSPTSADPERPRERRRGRDLAASTTAAASGSATRSAPAWSSSPTGPTRPRRSSSASSRPTPARASCGMPTPATRRLSTSRARAGSTSLGPGRRRLTATGSEPAGRLLIRDLAQVATPCWHGRAGARRRLREVDVLEGAYVLCDGPLVAEVGDAPAAHARWRRRGARRARPLGGAGLVDCHTHACSRATASSSRSGPAARPTRSCTPRAGASSRPFERRARGREALTRAVRAACRLDAAGGTTTFEAKSGYGLDRDTELAQLRAIRAAGGVATWLGAHAVPPGSPGGRGRLPRLPALRGPAGRGGLAQAADVFVERGALDVEQARRYLEACRSAGSSSGCATSSPSSAPSVSRSSSAPAPSTTSGRLGLSASPPSASPSRASSCPRARSSSAGRCRRHARSWRRARRSHSRPTSTPGARSARACRSSAPSPARSSPRPAEALTACTVNAAHVLSAADRAGGSPRASTPTSCSSRPTTGGTLRTTSAGLSSTASFEGGGSRGQARHNRRHANPQAAAAPREGAASRVRLGGRRGERARPGRRLAPQVRGATAPCRRWAPGTASVVAADVQARADLRADHARDGHVAVERHRLRRAGRAGRVHRRIFVPFSYFLDSVFWRS